MIERPMWTLASALLFINDVLEPLLVKAGFHAALAGSVLNKGESFKDLDIVVFPHTAANVYIEALIDAFLEADLTLVASRTQVSRVWERHGSRDTKHVEAWKTRDNRRIDFFILR